MGGIGLIFTPVLVRRLLRPSSIEKYNPPPASYSPTHHPLVHAIRDITVIVKKVVQNPAVLASYYR